MMNKILKFRNILAEQGIEMTVEEAKDAYSTASKFIKKCKKISLMNIWQIKDINYEGISEDEKKQIIDLYRKAKEL